MGRREQLLRFSRARIFSSAIFSILVWSAVAARATVLDIPVTQLRTDVRVSGSHVGLSCQGATSLREVGEPVLPYRIVNVLIPRGQRVASTAIDVSAPVELVRSFEPEVMSALRSVRGEPGASDGVAQRSADGRMWPGASARYLATGFYDGYVIASFAVFPLRIVDGALQLSESITLHITTEGDPGARPVRRLRLRPKLDARDSRRVATLVRNRGAVRGYLPAGVRVPHPSGGFQATPSPALEGSPVDYVIITNDSLAASWQRLADRKTASGIPAVVRTTEWIQSHYRNGVDLQETIRNFVIDAYQRWGITYVLLGGDTDQIPARLGASFYLADKDVPVDMYYGCLDGDWNADHDQYFGEGGPVPGGDAPDLYQEVLVGRLPSMNNTDVNVFINKLETYENPPDRSYTNRVLLLGEVLFPVDWNGVDPIAVDGAYISDILYQTAFTNPALSVSEMYENYVPYPGSVNETVSAVIDSINTGYNLINHVGHGFRFNMSVGSGSIVNGDADAFYNARRPSNVYLLNCTAVAYTYFCLGEHWLRNPSGGAVSVIGANESAFPIASQPYMDQYYSQIFNLGVNTIAQAFVNSRLGRTPIAELGDNVDLWTHYIYSILADPQQQLWTGPIDTLAVTYTDTIPLGPTTVNVSVQSGGMPLAGATVCLSRVGEDYTVGVTDGAGYAALSFSAESPGSVSVVVTARNHTRFQGEMVVAEPGVPYVSYKAVTVDDDSVGGTFGNSDGNLDAGEVVDLDLELVNGGTGTTGPLTVRLRNTSSGVTILDSVSTCVALAPGQSAHVDTPLRASITPYLADQTAMDFSVVVEQSGVPLWTDSFRKLAHAPVLDAVVLRIDDSVSGNGDGTVQAGENVDLYYAIKNRGTGMASGLTAALSRTSGGGFVLLDSISTYPDLAAEVEIENSVPFRVRETDTTVTHQLRLDVTDPYGRLYSKVFELRRPLPPDSLILDASLGPDRLHIVWAASPSPDVAHYLVYRSQVPGGPYTRVSKDPVDHTVFVDRPLQATTRYYYRITAVDASGNESVFSPEYEASTNPSQVTGWPIGMALETVSSPVVGDIDGDGTFEIVQGDDRVYAWHSNGTELLDADHNAQTWGVLSTQGDQFVSPIALADVDTVPGLDIIAASRNTREIYVFNYLGQVLPGWPQPVENPIRAGLVAGDIDGDGKREIIAIDELGVLYVYNRNGTEYRDGDSNPLTPGVFRRFGGCSYEYGSPTVGDMDGDGVNDLIVGTQGDSIFVFHSDGSSLPGWPVALTGDVSGSIAVGDIDNDGSLDLVANQWDGWVKAYHSDASVIWQRWMKNYLSFSPSPALGDLDGDGKLETVIPDANGNIYAITSTGGNLPGWPVVYSTKSWTESSPVIADMNRDGFPDVIVGDETRFINGWDAFGHELDGFPLATGDAVRATPTLADIDKDGDIDLIVSGWDKHVYVFDFPGMFDPQE